LTLPNPKVAGIKLNEINFNDDSYLITFNPDISKLVASIKKVSILNHPILEKTAKDSYRIVCGYKRLLALKQLNRKKISAYYFETRDTFPLLELFLFTIFENVATRALNIIEQANIVHKLVTTFHVPDEIIAKKFLPELDLGTNPKLINRFLKIYTLKDFLKKAIVDDFLSLDSALSISQLGKKEARQIFDLFLFLKIGKNKQKEFLRLVNDISKASQSAISDIINDAEIQQTVRDAKLTSPIKINRIKAQLKKLRYPHYSKVEEKFDLFKKELKLPPNMILRAPDFFEGEKFSFELKFKDQSEFNKMIEQLKQFVDQNKMKTLEKLME
jgi:ParB-like chromosome segregation protein Spo0J